MKYGKLLQELRQISGETQKQVARRVGIGRATLSDYENDKYTDPKISVLTKLCKHYGIVISEFIFNGKIVLDISEYSTIGKQKAINNHIAEESRKYETNKEESDFKDEY